jgi:hypothetical protein
MQSTTLRRIARRFPVMVLGLAGAIGLSASVGNAQSVVQLTDWNGNVLPAHSSLYAHYNHCAPTGGGVTVCDWYVHKLYGDNNAVVVAIHTGGVTPACNGGFTVHQLPNYSRSGCLVYVTAGAYGN